MNKQGTIQGIRDQLKAIKEVISTFKLSQLASESPAPASRSEQQQPAKRSPGIEPGSAPSEAPPHERQGLLRFGESARYMCSPEANLGKEPRPVFVLQLREAEKEWRLRHQASS